MTSSNLDLHTLGEHIAPAAMALAEAGRDFNQGILERFRRYFPERESAGEDWIAPEHNRFYQCVAQTLSWLQPGIDDDESEAQLLVRFYHRILLNACTKRNRDESESRTDMNDILKSDVESEIDRLKTRASEKASDEPWKPSRTRGVIVGLQTWVSTLLPGPPEGSPMSLIGLQDRVLSVGRVRWTSLAPLKLYALDRPELSINWPDDCYPPMGNRVTKGLASLFGLQLGETEIDYKHSLQMHIRLRNLAQRYSGSVRVSLMDINSGLQVLGSASRRR